MRHKQGVPKVRLPKRFTAVAVAGLFAGVVVGVPTASAAQNYAPNCSATANINSAEYTELAYQFTCTTYSTTATVDTSGDNNQGAWSAKAYDEGSYVLYTDGNWYRAALSATAADEPSKPQKDGDNNDITIWVKQASDTAASWAADSKTATATAGVFPSGYVAKETVSSVVHYYKANSATTGSDEPKNGGKWDEIAAGDLACISYYVTEGKSDWSATGSTNSDGVYTAQTVVHDAVGDKYYAAGADTTAADVPGTAAVWHEVTSSTCTRNGSAWTLKPGTDVAYTGPLPGGNKSVSVTYSGNVLGYSLVTLNRQIMGIDTEPPVIDGATSGPALNQTQYCVATIPSNGGACDLQSKADVYGKIAASAWSASGGAANNGVYPIGTYVTKDSKLYRAKKASIAGDVPGVATSTWTEASNNSLYQKVNGGTLAIKNATGDYSDLQSSNALYVDKGLNHLADSEFLSLGALGLPTNTGSKIFPAIAGNSITGGITLSRNACVWGDAPRIVLSVADGEGQVAVPFESQIESKYFQIDWSKGFKNPVEKYIARGCKFRNTYSNKVYYRDGSGAVKQISRAPQGQAGRVITADGTPADGYGTLG